MSEKTSLQGTLNLSLIHPDEINNIPSPVKNMPFDEYLDYDNDYVSSDTLEISDIEISDDLIVPPSTPISDEELAGENILHYDKDKDKDKDKDNKIKKVDIGNGKMDYIKDERSRVMLENAWQAINLTENWGFMTETIENFMFSNDKRISIITEKMEELGYYGHSGFSFGWTMRNMQFLAKNGLEKFKKFL